jgi:hypothetical protein
LQFIDVSGAVRFYSFFMRTLCIAVLSLGLAACGDFQSGRSRADREDPTTIGQRFENHYLPGGQPIHEAITKVGLRFLKSEVQDYIADANALFDVEHALDGAAHFDNCHFRVTSAKAVEHMDQAVDNIFRFPARFPPEDENTAALDLFAAVLHPMQDFYAHTNWIESGKTTIFDAGLGRLPVIAPYSILGGLVVLDEYGQDDGQGWSVHSADKGVEYPKSVLVTAKKQGTTWPALLSGAFPHALPAACPKIHGPGVTDISHGYLAKESELSHPDYPDMFSNAEILAAEQTTHEWCRLVSLVFIQHGAAGVKQLCDKWVADSTAANAACPSLPEAARCGDFYFNDFESSIGSEWTSTGGGGALGIDAAGGGGPGLNFLGLADAVPDGGLANNTVTLTLSLPTHSEVTVSFDFYGIRSLDGGFNCCGPDYFQFNVDTFTRTTSVGGPTQAFPNFLELGGSASDNPAYAGNQGFLGPSQNAVSIPMSFTVPHAAANLLVNFSMTGLQGVSDEGWGLDNVRVNFR